MRETVLLQRVEVPKVKGFWYLGLTLSTHNVMEVVVVR